MSSQSHTETSLTMTVETPAGVFSLDISSTEFQPTVDLGVVRTGTVQMRACVVDSERWVDLLSLESDAVIAKGGQHLKSLIAEQEADPAMAAALARARRRAGQRASAADAICGIAALRLSAGLSQRQLAERLSTQQPAVARWERDPEQMTLPTIRQLAAALGVPEQAIFDAVRGSVRRAADVQVVE